MPHYTPRQSSSASSLPMIAAAGFVGLGVVAVAGVLVYHQFRARGLPEVVASVPASDGAVAEQITARVDQLCHSIREQSVSKQTVYWLRHGCTVDDCKQLRDELERLKKETDTVRNKGISRWGESWSGLGELDPKRWERFEAFELAANKLVQSTLQRHDTLLQAECEQLNAKLAVEYPLTLEKMPTFDRTTVLGEQEYREWQIRQPAQDKLARAQRDAKIAREYANRLPLVSRKRILACRDECREGLAKLEDDFRKQ